MELYMWQVGEKMVTRDFIVAPMFAYARVGGTGDDC